MKAVQVRFSSVATEQTCVSSISPRFNDVLSDRRSLDAVVGGPCRARLLVLHADRDREGVGGQSAVHLAHSFSPFSN